MTGARSVPEWASEDDAEAPDAPNDLTRDPAEIAADILIDRVLASSELRRAVAQPGMAVVVEVPSGEWVDVIADAWRDTVRAGTEPTEGSTKKKDGRRAWREFRRSGLDHKSDAAPDRVGEYLAQGTALIGFSPASGQHLPKDLIRAADHTLVLGPLDAEIVEEVARRVTGTLPTVSLEPAAYSAVTPNILRISRRPKQSADDFLARLGKLLVRPKALTMPVPTLDQLHGMPEAVAWGKALAVDVEAYRMGTLGWASVDRGALIHGPTGTGKTTYARSLAAACGVPCIATSYAAWQATNTGHLGDVIRAMREVFDEARKAELSILFIDELDSVGSRNGDRRHDDWWRSIINCLLELLDGLSSREGVIVIGATNHPDIIDPAILRAGRLDRMILIGHPDHHALAKIFREHLLGDLAGTDLASAGLAAAGGTGADCEKWVRGARRRARQASRDMALEDLIAEIGSTDTVRSPRFLRRIALHEAAHAVHVAVHRPGSLQTVSVRQDHVSEGGLRSDGRMPDAVTAVEVKETICMLLTGRAAEHVILGSPSSGAGGSEHSDLASATAIAVAADVGLGFGESLVWYGQPEIRDVPKMLAARPDLAERVAAVLADCYQDAQAFVRANRAAIEAVAAMLCTKISAQGKEIEEVVGHYRTTSPGPPAAAFPAVSPREGGLGDVSKR